MTTATGTGSQPPDPQQQAHAIHARQVEAALAGLVDVALLAVTAVGVWADDARQDAEARQGVACSEPLPEPDPEHDRRLALHGMADGILRQARGLQYGVTR